MRKSARWCSWLLMADDHAVAAILCGVVKGAVGAVNPVRRALARSGRGQTDGDGDRDARLIMMDDQAAYCLQQPVGHPLALLQRHVIAEDGKLLAAIAGCAVTF